MAISLNHDSNTMIQLLLDLPLELQIKVLGFLDLMDVCLLMPIPALKPCIIERLPRDEITIGDFHNVFEEEGRDEYFPSVNEQNMRYNMVNYYSRHFKIFCNFLASVKLPNPIKTLSIKYLKGEEAENLLSKYIPDGDEKLFETIQITSFRPHSEFTSGFYEEDATIKVPWEKRYIAWEAYCLADDEEFNRLALLDQLMVIKNPSSLESQRLFLAFCFCINFGISDDMLDFSSIPSLDASTFYPLTYFEESTILRLLQTFRRYVLDSAVPMEEAVKTIILKADYNNCINISSFNNLEQLTIDGDNFERQNIGHLIHLRELRIVEVEELKFNLRLPQLSKLEVNCAEIVELNFSNLPNLEKLRVYQHHKSSSSLVSYIPSSIKSAEICDIMQSLVLSSTLNLNWSYFSLQKLTLNGFTSLDDFPCFVNCCPILRDLKVNLRNICFDFINFADKLPQTMNKLTLQNGKLANSRLDFSLLHNLEYLDIKNTQLSPLNVTWGTTIRNLSLISIYFEGKNLVIGNGSLDQLQHLHLKDVLFSNSNLNFGASSLLQSLFIRDTDFKREGLCKNLNYLEILEDYPGLEEYSELEQDSEMYVYMDFRYAEPRECVTGKKEQEEIVHVQSASDEDSMKRYRILKNRYGMKNDPLVFISFQPLNL